MGMGSSSCAKSPDNASIKKIAKASEKMARKPKLSERRHEVAIGLTVGLVLFMGYTTRETISFMLMILFEGIPEVMANLGGSFVAVVLIGLFFLKFAKE